MPAPPSVHSRAMGDVIGDRYEVLEVLWSGAGTDVARGLDRRHNRTVALKITHIEPGEDPVPLLDEGRLLLGLQPHTAMPTRSEEHTSELQSLRHLVCRLLLEKTKKNSNQAH